MKIVLPKFPTKDFIYRELDKARDRGFHIDGILADKDNSSHRNWMSNMFFKIFNNFKFK